MSDQASPPALDTAALNFEEALKELETIVRKLEDGQSSLEQSIEDYGRGIALKQHCEKKLQDARLKVEKILQNADGSVATAPFDGAE